MARRNLIGGIAAAALLLGACGASSGSSSDATENATTTTIDREEAAATWASEHLEQIVAFGRYDVDLTGAATVRDVGGISEACTDIEKWASKATKSDPAPVADLNTRWQQMITVANETAKTCFDNLTAGDLDLVGKTMDSADRMNTEVVAMTAALNKYIDGGS